MSQGLLNNLGALDAKEFTPTDDVELVMANPPPKMGAFPKAFIPNETGILVIRTLGGEDVPIPVVQGIPIPLTATQFRATGTSVGITSVVGLL